MCILMLQQPIMDVALEKVLQEVSAKYKPHKIHVQLEVILGLDSVNIQQPQVVFVQVDGRNLARFVKSNNVRQIDVGLYQGVVHWHVLQEHVKLMQKILAQVGHV